MKNKFKTENGSTLVEMWITVVLFSFALMSFYSIMLIGNRSYSSDSNYVELEQQARNSVDRIVRELRGATKSSISITTLSASNDRITFTTPNASNAKYYLNGSNQLIREYPSGTTKVMAVDIT